MRRRRDPFARETYIPRIIARVSDTVSPNATHARRIARQGCTWCGQGPSARRPLYQVWCEPDGGRDAALSGQVCSWACAEAYHDARIGR